MIVWVASCLNEYGLAFGRLGVAWKTCLCGVILVVRGDADDYCPGGVEGVQHVDGRATLDLLLAGHRDYRRLLHRMF